MLEILLGLGAKKSGGILYPNSGPGTKMLQVGDTAAGYFGEVSGEELMTNQGVWAFVTPAGGAPNTSVTSWLKFFIDNKVIFVAKKQVGTSTWNGLYDAGAVFGVRGAGTTPGANGATDQFKLALIKEGTKTWPLKLRLMRGLDNDAQDSTANDNSEWTRLMNRMWTGGIAPIWAQNALADLMGPPDITTVMMDAWTRSTNYTVTRGSTTSTVPVSTIPKTQNSYWRPVFELIDINGLAIDPQDVTYTGDGPTAPSIIEVPETATAWLQNPADVRYGVPALQDFGFVTSDFNYIPVFAVENWGNNTALQEFSVQTVTL